MLNKYSVELSCLLRCQYFYHIGIKPWNFLQLMCNNLNSRSFLTHSVRRAHHDKSGFGSQYQLSHSNLFTNNGSKDQVEMAVDDRNYGGFITHLKLYPELCTFRIPVAEIESEPVIQKDLSDQRQPYTLPSRFC